MKRTITILISIGLGAVLVSPIVGFRLWRWHHKKALFRADHVALLTACREMLGERSKYQTYVVNLPYYAPSTNWYHIRKEEFEAAGVPVAIRALKPKDLILYENSVRINMPAPRVSLVAFSEHSQQTGTVKLIDGLWYWSAKERQ